MRRIVVVVVLLALATSAAAAAPYSRRHMGGYLVLHLEGAPQQLGRQHGMMLRRKRRCDTTGR